MFGMWVAISLAVQQFKYIPEVTIMAVSKKSIVKSTTAKTTTAKASKSAIASPAAPAGKMVTAMKMAKNAMFAKSVTSM